MVYLDCFLKKHILNKMKLGSFKLGQAHVSISWKPSMTEQTRDFYKLSHLVEFYLTWPPKKTTLRKPQNYSYNK